MNYNKYQLYLHLCVGVFFLLLAGTLYYSFGYKYDFTTGQTRQMGGIVLRSTPREVVIEKDGEVVPNSGFLGGIFSPFIKIDDLEPRNYSIRVSKSGYNSWQKNVTISSGQVEKYENIVLLKEKYAAVPVLPDVTLPAPAQLSMAPDKNKLIFQGSVLAETGLFLVDLRDEKSTLILDQSQLALMGAIENVRWTEDEGRIVIVTRDNMYLLDLRDKNRVYLISAEVGAALRQAPDSPVYLFDHYLVFGQGAAVSSFDYVSKQTTRILDGVSSFYVYQGTLYYFKADATDLTPSLFSTNLGDLSYSVRVSDMPATYQSASAFTLQRYGGMLLVLSDGSLYLIDRTATTQRINSSVRDARFFAAGQRILYYNNNEIWVYYIEDKTSQPIKSATDNELLTRFSGSLSNIYVYADEEHLLFQENSNFKFTELDGRDMRNTFGLLDNASGANLFYLGDKDLVYYLGTDHKLYKLDLREA